MMCSFVSISQVDLFVITQSYSNTYGTSILYIMILNKQYNEHINNKGTGTTEEKQYMDNVETSKSHQ